MANTMLLVFDLLFGCWHRHLSRPFTLPGWTYQVCLNCGKKLAYDRAEIGCTVAQPKNLGYSEMRGGGAQISQAMVSLQGEPAGAIRAFAFRRAEFSAPRKDDNRWKPIG
jgi:hypothetical protein